MEGREMGRNVGDQNKTAQMLKQEAKALLEKAKLKEQIEKLKKK